MTLLPFKRGHRPGTWLVCRAFVVERDQPKIGGLHTVHGPFLARSVKPGDRVLDFVDLEISYSEDVLSDKVRLVSAVALVDDVNVRLTGKFRGAALGDDSYHEGVEDEILTSVVDELLTGGGPWGVVQISWDRVEDTEGQDAFGTIGEHPINKDTGELLRARFERVCKADDAVRSLLA